MSQSTDGLTRSQLRAIHGHYRCATSPGAPLACLATGTSRRDQPGLPAVAAGIEAWREGVLRRRVARMQRDSAKQPD
jgi:hypothetical protein